MRFPCFNCSPLRMSLFTNADISVPYCRYQSSPLRISMFTADVNAPYCGYELHRCGYRRSLVRILPVLPTNANFLFTVNKLETCLIKSMIFYSHSLFCTVSWQHVNYIQSGNDMAQTITDIVSS